MSSIVPLRTFVSAFSTLLEQTGDETRILEKGGALLADLVAGDSWLPEQLAQPDPDRYQQFLLHADSGGRFSIVSFVWGPGQSTPIHDHTVWGLIGMLRGAEYSQGFRREADGELVPDGEAILLKPGQVEAVSPTIGDIHRVYNAYPDQVSVSIHVYGANIGAVRRSVYREDGTIAEFISGYSNDWIPNIWNESKP